MRGALISGKRKLTSGKMEDKENGKTPAQLKDERL